MEENKMITMARMKEFLESVRNDPKFIRTMSTYLNGNGYKSDFTRMAVDGTGSVLVPLYKDSITTFAGTPRLPDAYIKLIRENGTWEVEGFYKNPEPQVL